MIRMSVLVSLALAGCLSLSNGDPTSESLELDRAMSEFSLRLYKELALQKSNAIYSPASIYLALSMAYLGARGSTAEEMRTVLQIRNVTNIHELHRKWLEYITTRNDSTLLVCNSVWSNPNVIVHQEYKDELISRYYADVERLNFSSPDGPEKPINDWVSNRTADNIREIIPKGLLREKDTILVLVNTIYFNGTWENQFSEEATVKGMFHRSDNTGVDADFMHQVGLFAYKEEAYMGADLVRLPFKGGDISFYILLPKSVSGLVKIEKGLSSDSGVLDSLFDGMPMEDLLVKMPKFRLEASMKLNDPLIKLGMQKAFSVEADFSGVSDGLVRISQVCQKAVIEVMESGTFAGAATQILEQELILPPFVDVSRPFMFFLRDDRNKRILFQGKLTDPSVTKINIE
ncbi:unnamed protein product [Lymnaea stagnalis]|uniref:Serpin domain-containing protein n=1 Tax=Lymnaea stagnalis TaxID=6523 RepID=A0AAV2HX07_LYMST